MSSVASSHVFPVAELAHVIDAAKPKRRLLGGSKDDFEATLKSVRSAVFDFEHAGIVPDIVTVSKSISGSGLPMSLVLLRPEVDVWKPGAHTGTFRGNNLAFVSARVALETYWSDSTLMDGVAAKNQLLRTELERIAAEYPEQGFVVRGRGLMMGIACDSDPTLAGRVSKAAFERGLVIETSGAFDEVLKFLPALTISEDELRRGLEIVRESLAAVLAG